MVACISTKTKKVKALTIFILFFCIAYSTAAQKKFEGIIVYKLTALHKKATFFKEVHFKDGKLRCILRTSHFHRTCKADWLINFDSLLIAFTNSWNDTGYAKPLDEVEPGTDPHLLKSGQQGKTILGYQTTTYKGFDSGGLHSDRANRFYAWYADALLFSIPSSYLTAQIAGFGNGRAICLGMILHFKNPAEDFKMSAVSVKPQSLPDSQFLITRYNPWEVNREISDEATVKVDSLPALANDTTALEHFRNPHAPKHKPSSKNTHKQPTKSPATKPKESVTYKKMP